MIAVGFRVDEEIAKKVAALASRSGVSESHMWRLIVSRGMDKEINQSTSMLVEILCISRRHAAYVDRDVLFDAKKDTKIILEDIISKSLTED